MFSLPCPCPPAESLLGAEHIGSSPVLILPLRADIFSVFGEQHKWTGVDFQTNIIVIYLLLCPNVAIIYVFVFFGQNPYVAKKEQRIFS